MKINEFSFPVTKNYHKKKNPFGNLNHLMVKVKGFQIKSVKTVLQTNNLTITQNDFESTSERSGIII